MKKIFFTLFACLTFINTFAIPKGPCDKDFDVCCEEPVPGPFAFSYSEDRDLPCPKGFYLGGEFLLMQVQEEGLEYAIAQETGYEPEPDTTIYSLFPLTGGEIKGYSTGSKNWDWTCGSRVKMGFYTDKNKWNVEGMWTYIRINNDSGINPSNGGLIPLFLAPSVLYGLYEGVQNMSASARWTGNINIIEINFGKPYHISRYVTFNPYFGIKSAHINQDFTARYGGVFEAYPGRALKSATNLKTLFKNDFWGIGPKVGLKSDWLFGKNFSFLGNVAASILYSHFDVCQSIHIQDITYFQIKHDFYTNTPNVEIQMGLSWFCVFKEKTKFSLKVAYEMQRFWEMNRFRRFFDRDFATGQASAPSSNDEISKGDMNIHGFSFAVELDY